MSSSFSCPPTSSAGGVGSSAPWHWSFKCTIAGDPGVGKTELLACRERIEWLRLREGEKYLQKFKEEKRKGKVDAKRKTEESGEIPLRRMHSLMKNLALSSSTTDSAALDSDTTLFGGLNTSGALRRRTPHVFRCFEVVHTGSLPHNFSSCPSFDASTEPLPRSQTVGASVFSSMSSPEAFRGTNSYYPHRQQQAYPHSPHPPHVVSGSGTWRGMGGMGYSPSMHATAILHEVSQDFHKKESEPDDDEGSGDGGVRESMGSRDWQDNKRRGKEKGEGREGRAMKAMTMEVEKSLDSVRASGCSSVVVGAAGVMVPAATGPTEYTLTTDHAAMDEVIHDFSEDCTEGAEEDGNDATGDKVGERRQSEVDDGGEGGWNSGTTTSTTTTTAAAAGGARQEKKKDQKKKKNTMGKLTRFLPFQATENVEPHITSASPLRGLHRKKNHRRRSPQQQHPEQRHHPRLLSDSPLHMNSTTESSFSSGGLTVQLCLWDTRCTPSRSPPPSSPFPLPPSVLSNFSFSCIILLVCSATDRESFLHIGEWVHCCRSFASPSSVIALVLNKVDFLYSMKTASTSCTNSPVSAALGGGGGHHPCPVETTGDNIVTVEEASAFAQAHQLLFFPCSAIHNKGVEWLFHNVTTEVLKRLTLRQIVPERGEGDMETHCGSRHASLLCGYRSGVKLHPRRRVVSKAVESEEGMSWGFCCGYLC